MKNPTTPSQPDHLLQQRLFEKTNNQRAKLLTDLNPGSTPDQHLPQLSNTGDIKLFLDLYSKYPNISTLLLNATLGLQTKIVELTDDPQVELALEEINELTAERTAEISFPYEFDILDNLAHIRTLALIYFSRFKSFPGKLLKDELIFSMCMELESTGVAIPFIIARHITDQHRSRLEAFMTSLKNCIDRTFVKTTIAKIKQVTGENPESNKSACSIDSIAEEILANNCCEDVATDYQNLLTELQSIDNFVAILLGIKGSEQLA